MSALTTIAQGDASRVSEPRRIVARTDDEWRALWAIHAGPDADAPALDMARVIVAAAFAGEKPSAGYALEIARAETTAGGVDLVVLERQPGPGAAFAQILTSPFHIVAVPKGVEVTWSEERGAGSEERGLRSSTLDPRSSILDPPASHLALGTSHVALGTSHVALGSSTGLDPKTASALAYLAGPFSGALMLLAESTSDVVRFHAWQSIVGLGGLGLAVVASYILAFAAIFVSATAVSLMVGVATVIWIVLAIVWGTCLWKALSGERWKLPLAGDFAERLATSPGASAAS